MPRRRGKRRRQSQNACCDNSSKRQLVSCCQRLTGEESCEESCELPCVPETPTVTPLEHLAQVLPPELLTQLQTAPPHPWHTRSKCNAVLPTLSLDTPSFCIGRVYLSLRTGVSLRELLCRLRLLDAEFHSQLYLNDGFLELLFDGSESFHLPVSVSPPSFPIWCLRSSGLYVTQLVLNLEEEANDEGERERGEGGSHTSDSGLGDSLQMFENGGSVGVGLNMEEEELPSAATRRAIDGSLEELVEGKCGGGGSVEGENGEDGSVVIGKGGQLGSGEAGDGGSVSVEVWVGGREICEPGDPNALPPHGNIPRLIQLVKAFHPRPPDETANSKPAPVGHQRLSIAARIEQFYRDVKQKSKELYSENEYDTSLIPGLTAELRGYQRKAVQWMLDRENGLEMSDNRSSHELHLLWRELSVPCHGTLYFSPYTGRLASEGYCPPRAPLGGILADEMGLGKTVEVLALLMAHRAPLLPLSPSTTSPGGPPTLILSSSTTNPGAPPLSLTNHRHNIERGGAVQSTSQPQVVQEEGEEGEGDERGEEQSRWRGEETIEEDEMEVVQCVCGATSETGSEYVQCEKCRVWLHSHCVSFQSSKHSTFVCIRCLLDEPLSSRATLIISPRTILQQWREEIQKHTSHNYLSVMHYEGVKNGFVSPYELAECDVVLVSYETLSLELNYAKSHEVSRVLRYTKRYSAAPSPLPAVHWWRVCLDEAQMVESAVTKPAEMCLRLQAHHRWCVTGTPIQRDLNDLYGLVLFLDAEPYCQSQWYRRLISQPYHEGHSTPIVDLFSSLMWRNSKDDVAHELQLPEQTEQTHWLTFSLVEKYFYRKQREMCRTEASKVLSRLGHNYTLSSLTQDTVQRIMTPLHSLRRACCHPQMVRRGGYIPVNHKKSLTMPQLLEKLTAQAKLEAREGLRKSILSLNGLAGLYILKFEWRKARETYEQAISMWREYKEKEVECDRLQRIHTLENLAWLLEQGHCTPEELSGGPWRNAASLREQAGELRAQFLGKTEGLVRTAAQAVMTCKRATRDSCRGGVAVSYSSSGGRVRDTSRQDNQDSSRIQNNTVLQDSTTSTAVPDRDSSLPANQEATCQEREVTNPVPMDTTGDSISTAAIWEKADETPVVHLLDWVGAAIKWVEKGVGPDFVEQLMGTINSHILDSSQLMLGHEVSGRVTDISTIHFIAFFHLHKLEEARVQSLRSLHSLLPPPSQWEVEQAYHCHLVLSREGEEEERGRRATGLLACDVCKAESVLVQYGSQLFSHYSYTNSMGQEHGEGARGAHAFEKIVRSFLTSLRHRRAPREILDAGKILVAYIEAVKKEYDALRGLWQSLGHRVSQYDELRLATSRMRYMTPSELTDGGSTADTSAVHPMFWTVKKDVFESERVLAWNELTRSLGQVVYLKNLAKTPVSDSDCGSCPICTRLLGKEIDEWGMLPCGHPLCMECVLELTRRAYHAVWQIRGGGSARLSCPLCRFSFLSSEINTVRPTEPEHMGNLSTKIRGVVQTLQTIQSESATAKTLVFSYWVETLDLVSASLAEYDIAHCFLKTPKTFQDNLSEFKKSKDVNVLLMPLHSGSKGLNIVEATHVILVEPGLNVGAELQAIGRVHRMGQTKPTTVHRLVIRDSVEENIHHLLSSSHSHNNSHTRKEGESALTLRELEALFN